MPWSRLGPPVEWELAHWLPDADVTRWADRYRELYPEILARSGLVLEQRYQRHVNRRTGRRAGEYFEDVLVARI